MLSKIRFQNSVNSKKQEKISGYQSKDVASTVGIHSRKMKIFILLCSKELLTTFFARIVMIRLWKIYRKEAHNDRTAICKGKKTL